VEIELSEDQSFFLDTTRRFLTAEASMPAVRALEQEPAGWTADYWRQGAELGWTSMLVPEADGGGSLSEHGLLDLVLVAEEIGRCAGPGPLAPVNLVASAVAARGSHEQKAAVLPGLLDGSAVATWGGREPVIGTVAEGSITLTGRLTAVEAAAQSAHLLVVAATATGLTHVLVPADAVGLSVTPRRSLDLVRRFAEVAFDGVALPVADAVVGDVGGAANEVERLLQVACVLQCAETCGAIDKVFAMTVEYLGDRYSFGRPLSSYQALKHRLADDKMHLEACHATAGAAARAVATGAADAGELVSVAKAWIGPHATELIQDGVQLHGGIGVTWEHDLHLYLRRATVNRAMHGTPEWHAERIATVQLGVVA
jgi:alkylation response protein AidB-like acyl-CoA dehydrogenase